MFRLPALLVLLTVTLPALADDWPQFRGPERTGVSKEKGLLQSWPKGGPKLLWTYRNAGLGFGGPSIVGARAYLLGARDEQTYLICLDVEKGQEVWSRKIGPIFTFNKNYWGDGPRSNPTVAGDLIYCLDGTGELVCVKTDGKEVWRKNLVTDFGGKMMTTWGYSESPLVDGEQVVVMPGGKKASIVALNRTTGAVIWKTDELSDKATYSSAVVAEIGGVRQYVQQTYNSEGGHAVGVSAKDGKLLWKQQVFEGDSYAAVPTPIVVGNLVYITNGYGMGCHLLQIEKKGDKFSVTDLYPEDRHQSMMNTHGGVVLVNGHFYGHTEPSTWICQEFKTGKVLWKERKKLECKSGAIAAADGRLYLFSEEGEAVLLKSSPKGWEEEGRFTIPEKSKTPETRATSVASKIWAHPVIANGRLYLRDQELLFCYAVAAK